jgi:cyclopropane-fatty-acyl-phospholipid synthase
MSMTLADLVGDILGEDLAVAVRAYDGSRLGPPSAPATVILRSPDALRRILFAPGELGLARAYVAGDIDVEGDILAAVALRDRLPDLNLTPRQLLRVARLLGAARLRPLPPPPEEVRLRGRLHSRERDSKAVAHHYDVSNSFYELLLGPSMTYTCAVFEDPEDSLEQAQTAKYELVCRKLGLEPGMRILDAGCGWGSMAIHAAQRFGVSVVGVTISQMQVDLARKRVAEAGMTDRVEIRLQDYRDVDDGPFDAISVIGMLENIGSQLHVYVRAMHDLLRLGGRFLHHAISRPPGRKALVKRPTLLSRYVFPDADLHEIGTIVSAIQAAGLEARHMESFRDHYVITLRHWLSNLETHWDAAVVEAGLGTARIWRLYLAAALLGFPANRIQVHQVLAIRPRHGSSAMPLRPSWDGTPLGP